MTRLIRPLTPAAVPTAWAIHQANVPAVGSE